MKSLKSTSVLEKVADRIDRFSELSGKIVSWLVLGMALLIGYDVAMRYLFHSGSVALQELEWHLFAMVFLLAGAYTLKHDAHVRVDLLYRSHLLTDRHRLWVDLAGTVLFLVPFSVLVVVSALPFVENAFLFGEASPDPGGLTHRFLLKAVIPLGFILILIQAVGNLCRQSSQLLGARNKGESS